jgi:hypothetical protein
LIGGIKRKVDKKEGSGIYNIRCGDCEANYIGQTRRSINTRESEHDKAFEKRQPQDSAFAAHRLNFKHQKGTCTVLKNENNPFYLDAWESLYMARGRDLVNDAEAPIRSKLFTLTMEKS